MATSYVHVCVCVVRFTIRIRLLWHGKMCTVVSKSGASTPSYKFGMADLQLESLNHSVFFSFRGGRLATMPWNATMYTEYLAHKSVRAASYLERSLAVFQGLC